MPLKKIRVLVIDDSLLFREVLAKGIERDPGIEVVGTAADPFIARDMILQFEPDVLTLDVEMPKMNGIEFLKKLMPQYPLPVVVVSSTNDRVFDALNAGAVDFVAKPNLMKQEGLESFISQLIITIKIASVAKINRENVITDTSRNDSSAVRGYELIAIGASTGGTEAIYNIIKMLPNDLPGIVIVQHMPPVFTKMYAERLNNTCSLFVKEAENGDIISPGKVLIAPGEFHMKVTRSRDGSYYVECKRGDRVNGHCPSVDVLFNSISEIRGISSIGIILTGMGYDGAKGLLNMRRNGAFTIGQDEQSSVVYGMPKVAYDIGAVQRQEPLYRIPDTIMSTLNSKNLKK